MRSDALIGARITTIFDDEHGLYGAKRIAASLNSDTDFGPINHKKVARIMKAMGLKGGPDPRRVHFPGVGPNHILESQIHHFPGLDPRRSSPRRRCMSSFESSVIC
ncbi:transposase [Corynebacterium phoceense]